MTNSTLYLTTKKMQQTINPVLIGQLHSPTCMRLLFVMDGRTAGDFGVTYVPSFVMPKKLDVENSSTSV